MMLLVIVLQLVVLSQGIIVEMAATAKSTNLEAVVFLQKFGYIEQNKLAAELISAETVVQAIANYQDFYSLNPTGVLDKKTLQQMEKPRCGNPDKLWSKSGKSGQTVRIKRAIEGESKWTRLQLTYNIWNYPKLLKSRRNDVDAEIKRAFDSWSEFVPIDLTKTTGEADINITFEVGKHCRDKSFDGSGHVLGHAFFPEIGEVHFDDDEAWAIGEGISGPSVDLYAVALHEFGHVLGIEHKSDPRALMFPTYGQTDKLHEIDINSIQAVYGRRQVKPPLNSAPKPTQPPARKPNLCKDPNIGAITTLGNGRVLLFKGDFYWFLNKDSDGIENGYPRLISKDWLGLPGSIDAAFYWESSGSLFFFKDDKYWKFVGAEPAPGNPRLISEGFQGIPNDIDGAFVSKEKKIFFFKGDEYWKYETEEEQKVGSNYPQSISVWKGVPSSINDVTLWSNNKTYFFKGDIYYKYNDDEDQVEANAEPPFPRSTAEWWFGCDDYLSGSAYSKSGSPKHLDEAASDSLALKLIGELNKYAKSIRDPDSRN